jgi:hypothetical protein
MHVRLDWSWVVTALAAVLAVALFGWVAATTYAAPASTCPAEACV